MSLIYFGPPFSGPAFSVNPLMQEIQYMLAYVNSSKLIKKRWKRCL